jgi:hypothetical protein
MLPPLPEPLPPETVWAEEGGRQVTVEDCGGTVRLTIADSDGKSTTATITHYRWIRITAAVRARPDGWGRGMFIAGAAAGVTPRKRKIKP